MQSHTTREGDEEYRKQQDLQKIGVTMSPSITTALAKMSEYFVDQYRSCIFGPLRPGDMQL